MSSRWWRNWLSWPSTLGGDSRRVAASFQLAPAGYRRPTICRPQLEMLEARVLPAWTILAPMPTPRTELAAAMGGDGRIYAIGGADANGAPLATVEAYNTATNTWFTAASLNVARSGLAAAEAKDGTIVVMGGMASSGLTNVVERYDPSKNTWSQVATIPTPRTELAAARGSDNRIYAIGGANASGTPLATVEAYDPTKNTWATVTSLNTARSGLAAVAESNGRILAFGGKDATALTNVVEMLAPGPTAKWNAVATLPTVRSLLGGALGGDGHIYAIGGADANNNPLNVVEGYTPPMTNAWATAAMLNTSRSGLAAAEGPDNRIYALGGTNGTTPLANVEALSVVNKASTSTVVASSLNPSVSGQSVTFTATISGMASGAGAPTGTVQFQIDGRNVGNPVSVTTAAGVTTASFTTALTAGTTGTHTITANYSGDNIFAGSSGTLPGVQTVNKASTSTAITSSFNPSVTGQSVIFTATISVIDPGSGTPTGTVQFQIDGGNAGSPVSVSTAGGVTTATFSTTSLATPLAVGTHTVTGSYSGDNNFAPSSGTLSGGQVVNTVGMGLNTTTVSSSVGTPVFGQTVTFTATITPQDMSAGTPTGTVQFQIDGSNADGPVKVSSSGGATTASFSTSTLTVGTHTITASYSGDVTFANSSGSLTQTVDKAATSLTVASSANPSVFRQSTTFTATISIVPPGTGTPTGTVQFAIDGSNAGSPVGVSKSGTASFSTTLAVGMHTVTATYSGDSNSAASSGTLSGGQLVIVPPPSNAAFVDQIYLDLLNRPVDPSGSATFNSALNNGISRFQVAYAIVTSTEYRTDLVESFYSLYLHRVADSTGLTLAVQFLNTGGTDEQLQAGIAGSLEYFQTRGGGTNQGFLVALYQDALGRAIDPSGQAAYSQALAAGISREQVAAAIFGSSEYHRNLVESYYMKFLLRAADSGGLNTFVGALQNGITDETVIAAIVGSPEYFMLL